MSFSEALIRFVAGGLLVLAVSLAARYGKSHVAGMLALFPVVTAISFYFMSKTVDTGELRKAVLSSTLAIPAVLAFLAALYFCLKHFSIGKSLIISILAWLAAALVILLVRGRLNTF